MMQTNAGADRPDDLFLNLAEQVKLPFVQITQAAQLMQGNLDPISSEHSRQTILLASQAALHLIDGYLLSIAMQREQQLDLEPVSLSSVLYDTAQTLGNYAKAHGCRLELQVAGKYVPVMANRAVVQAALTSLGYSFIEAAAAADGPEPVVQLVARRSAEGITTGVISNQGNMGSTVLSRARALYGKVHQPLAGFDSGNGSGIFVADALFEQLQATMKPVKIQGLQGLAATLLPSRQLHLV